MKNWRFYALVFFISLIFIIVIFRFFSLQALKYSLYKTLAFNQHQTFQIIEPLRGEIFMRDRYTSSDSRSLLFPVALNKDLYTVYAIPNIIEDKDEAIEQLFPILEMDKSILEFRINKADDPYEPLKNKIDEQTAEIIKNLNIKGIDLKRENWRYFPANNMACHLLGFVGFDEDKKIGRYGIEENYEDELGGEQGFVEAKRDSLGNILSVNNNVLKEAEDGADIILTIDPNVQYFVEEILEKSIKDLDAESGTILVMDIKTGAIKAMASYPAFNPNEYNEVKNINVFLNPAIQELFEPGSIFKPITMAAALDSGAVTPRTTYEDKGSIAISGYILKNATDGIKGIQTMVQVLEKSLNTGAIFAQQQIGKDNFKKYVEKFGFNEKTGIDLKGELNGNLSNLNKKQDLEYATAAFGQGIAITSIQMITALSAIANDGILLRPYVVEKIIYKDGSEKITETKERRRVISSQTASKLTAMLISVVDNGFSRKAGVEGYKIAGKTGTAQIAEAGGYSEETIHSFGGFFPGLSPRFSILVKIDKPKTIRFASDSVTPIFSKIAKYILNYYEIAP